MRMLALTPGTPGLAAAHLVEYLKTQPQHSLTTITHPVAPLPFRRSSTKNKRKFWREPFHVPLFTYLVDMGYTFPLVFLERRYDVVVCISPHLALTGILLRKLGWVKKTVYWALDYYPKRYGRGGVSPAALLEPIYRNLEKYVVKNSDLLWTITPNMPEGWRQGNYKWKAPIRIVPHCTTNSTVPQRHRSAVIWAGNLQRGREFGFDLLVEAWPLVKQSCPNLKLTVTSRTRIDGKYGSFLNRNDVTFRGFVADPKEFKTLVGSHLAGISPYIGGTYKEYSDVAGAKFFASCGVPVVLSSNTYTANYVREYKAGIVIEPTVEDLARGVVEVVSNPVLNRRLSLGAYELALAHEGTKIFGPELAYLEKLL